MPFLRFRNSYAELLGVGPQTLRPRCERRAWGHVHSEEFEGGLFFHFQRSPELRAVTWERHLASQSRLMLYLSKILSGETLVSFEVVEINGRYEAVNISLPVENKDVGDPKDCSCWILGNTS